MKSLPSPTFQRPRGKKKGGAMPRRGAVEKQGRGGGKGGKKQTETSPMAFGSFTRVNHSKNGGNGGEKKNGGGQGWTGV